MKEIKTKDIRTYEVQIAKEIYRVYTCVNDKDKLYTNFYLHNPKYGIISFMVGCVCDSIYTEEDIISNNIVDWVDCYKQEYED